MARPVAKVKNGLKLKTKSKSGALTLRLGVKKYTLPFDARLITSDKFVFLHIPPTAELMKITTKGLEVMADDADATEALSTFRKARASRKAAKEEMPSDVAKILQQLPKGFRIAYNQDGSPRLVKMRKRRSSSK